MYNYFAIVFAYDLTGEGVFGATLFLLMNLPYIIFGFLTSKVTELISKKKVILWAQYLYIILLCILSIAISNIINIKIFQNIFMLISLMIGLSFAFLPASRLAIIGELNESRSIGRVSLFVNLLYILAFGLGPISVGFLQQYISDIQILFLICIFFFISNLLLSLVKAEGLLEKTQSLILYWKDLHSFLSTNKRLFLLLILIPYTTLLLGPFQVLIPLYAESVFKLDDSFKPIYFLVMAFGLGLGGILAVYIRGLKFNFVIFGSSVLAGLSISILLFFENLVLSVISILIASLCCSYATNSIVLLIQNSLKEKFRLRILNIYSILQLGSSALIGFFASKLSSFYNSLLTFQALGLLLILLSVILFLSFSVKKIDLNEKYNISG